MPFLHRRWLHEMGAIFPLVQEQGKHNPQKTKTGCEPRSRIFFLLDPVSAHGQLALRGE